jgi:ABC-type transporter Mla subunit MlaD
VAAWFVSHKQQLRDDASKAKADQAKADQAKAPAVADTAVADTAVVARTLTELTAQIEALATQQAQLRATIERLTEQRSA